MKRPLSRASIALLVALAGTARAQADDELSALERALDRDAGHPRALAHVIRLRELAAEGAEISHVVRLLSQVADDARVHPEVRAEARYGLVRAERTRGRLHRARGIAQRLGMVTAWSLVGPFDNEGRAGHAAAYGPESQPWDPAAVFAGKEREVRWRMAEKLAPFGVLRVGDLVRPRSAVTVYAQTILDAPRARPVHLYLGASGAAKVWVNGALVHDDPADHPAAFDQALVPAQLEKGENRVLVKISHGEGPFELMLRVADPSGRPAPEIKARAAPLGATPIVKEARRLLPRPDDALGRLCKAARASRDASLRADCALALMARRPFDAPERRHRAEAAEAARLAPKDERVLLLLARTEEDDANRRRLALESAAAAAPASAAPQIALAEHFLDRGDAHRALPFARRAASLEPKNARARLALVRAYDGIGNAARAARLAFELADEMPASSAAQQAAARYARRLSRAPEVERRLRVALALRYDEAAARSALWGALLEKGDLDGALREMRIAHTLEPTDAELLVRQGDLLSANGRAAAATACYDAAAALAPDEPSIYEQRGRHRLALRDKSGARADFEHALSLRPNNPALRELVRAVFPLDPFAAPYLADAVSLARSPDAESEDAVILADVEAVRVYKSGLASRVTQQIVRVRTGRGVEQHRQKVLRYTPSRQQIQLVSARIFKPDGSIVESHAEGERPLNEPWSGLYYDVRARVLTFNALAPGDVLEVSWRTDDTAQNHLGDYFGDLHFLQGTEPRRLSCYVLVGPPGRSFETFASPLPGLTFAREEGPDGGAVLRWTARDVPKIDPEPGMPGWSEAAAYVHVSTHRDWESVGRLYWGLVQKQLEPTPEVRDAAQEAAGAIPASDLAARVKAVYGFVVGRTRYVGLEFGIHSYQPYPVDRVLARRFGDCKDKASLMHAMLASLGIESRLALVRTRRLGRVVQAPASLAVFDHAILYVPALDLWLDGTASFHGSRELPGEDQGALALVVEPGGAGSRLVTLPTTSAADNLTVARARVQVSADGAARAVGESRIAGEQAASYRRAYETAQSRRELFEQGLSRTFPGARVLSFDLSDPRRLEEDVQLAYEVTIPRYAESDGDELLFNPFGGAGRYVETYAPLSARRHELVVGTPWRNEFRYDVAAPEGFAPTSLPEPAAVEGPFGSFSVRYAVEGGRLVAEGAVQLTRHRIAPAEYAAFRSFLGQVDAAMSRKIRLGRLPPPVRAPEER